MTPATSPGGRGPSLSNNPNTSTGHWFDIFGPVLSVHDGHGYSTWDRFVHTGRALPTGDILRGRTSIGVYFCADWCGPCKAFTPILKTYYEAQRASRLRNDESTLEIVLVSRCRTWQESEALFSTMPWTAMSHLDSTERPHDKVRGDDHPGTSPTRWHGRDHMSGRTGRGGTTTGSGRQGRRGNRRWSTQGRHHSGNAGDTKGPTPRGGRYSS